MHALARPRAACANFSPGKDAGLSSSLKLNVRPARDHSPRPNRCARIARRAARNFAFCILHFAFCILASGAFAQELLAPTELAVTRLPKIDPAVQQAQFAPPPLPYPQTVPPPMPLLPATPAGQTSFRSIKVLPRAAGLGPNIQSADTPTGEKVAVVDGGVNVIVSGLTVEGLPTEFGPLGDVDIETDRAVIWGADLTTFNSTTSAEAPLEIYMEGNIVFRQGDRTVFADRMFYDVRRQIGIILNAELLTPIPQIDDYQYVGLVRLRAAAIRQLDQQHFVAQNGLLTSSRLEVPSYAFTADTITFEDLQTPAIDPLTGAPVVDPIAGPIPAHNAQVQSQNNFVYIGNVPVFYWPSLSTNLEKPSYFIDNVRIRNDSIFGFQALLEFDAFQLLSMEAPVGVEWDVNLDVLTQRGVGFGTGVQYGRDDFFGLVGPTSGRFDGWFINDDGHDNLGQGRRDITPEEDFRGRVFWNHRQHLIGGPLDDWVVQAEVGWISDRTFLEQYYEQEWEDNKDQLTGVRLKRTYGNQSVSIEANGRINDFFTQTQWLPRLDHNWLGEPLLGDQLTWFEHSTAAYADIGIASTPDTAQLAAIFERLPWEDDNLGNPISGNGERFTTRQEIDYPIDLAPFKVVPFALGELYHAGEDINSDDIQRAYVHTGVRASIPFWHVEPAISDPLFNLNGLAHKVVFDAEASYTDATRDLNQFPLYDEIDDDSIEEMRRRLFFAPFGGELPGTFYIPGAPSFIDARFDPRFYALRSGLHGWVTSPSSEIADDLAAVRVGMRHRLQTKRGPIEAPRIVDWVTLDANATWFPDDTRDNFGEPFGMLDYDLRWHLGDRFSILSDGNAETFGDGLRTASIGVLMNRPMRGNAYLGFRTFGGIIDSNVINTTLNYWISPKWIASAGASFEIGGSGNNSQNLAFTRIGESLNVGLGANYDQSKDNVGVSFLIEPRILPNSQLSRRTGIEVPPAGAYFLE
jgi:hypothetical protein